MNIAQFLHHSARIYGDRPALAVGKKVVKSYRDLSQRVASLASGMQKHYGLQAGDRVAFAMKNCPEYWELMFACWHAGLAAVPMNAKGLRILSRKSYEQHARSEFDYPLSYRFDENDAVLYFDEVDIPWERVFVLNDRALCQKQFYDTPCYVYQEYQAVIRSAVKLRFLAGLALERAEPVLLGEVAVLFAALLLLQEVAEAVFLVPLRHRCASPSGLPAGAASRWRGAPNGTRGRGAPARPPPAEPPDPG